MSVLGIDQITYAAEDLAVSRSFFQDWGLVLKSEAADELVFECLNGCKVVVAALSKPGLPPGMEEGPTLREVVWGVESDADLARYAAAIAEDPGFVDGQVDGARRIGCIDPNGLAVRLQVSRKHAVEVDCGAMNTWNAKPRINQPAPLYERATPIEVGHVVFFVSDVKSTGAFYSERFGFVASDSYPNRGAFLRCAAEGGHHDLFLLQLPSGKRGLNHVAFTVRDIHEVFGGGLHFSRQGWETQLGPGRHPVSSAYFWYFKNPAGGLIEYYADEDQLTAEWQPREFEPGPTVFAEWAVDGGLDGHTRRQKNAEGPKGAFPDGEEMIDLTNRPLRLAAAALFAFAALGSAQARTEAHKQLASERFTIVSPFPPGGPVDTLARVLAEGLAKRHGQPAVVENLAGAAGNIGIDKVKRAKGDGHTLLVVPAGNLTINPTLMPNFPFDIAKDFVPVTMLATAPNVLVATPASGFKNAKEVVAQAKAKPNTLSYASPGVGSGLHLAGELFKQQAGVDLLHVPYKGTAPALNDVLGGVVPLMFSNLPATLPFIKSGKLVALGVTEAKRSPVAPEIPTLAEQGIPGVSVTSWYGLLAPAGTPPAVAEQLARDAAEILATPEVRERLKAQGMTDASMKPAEFAAAIRDETAVWAKIIKARNIVAE